ncbi:MAG: hypothetical protein WAP20_01210 [Limnochordia bacterium]|jgi:hypothetical protein|nr:hypothetical protein [Bacillota bacterium]HOB08753.1 hypothetical protein [Limnochordia bacterium]NLH31705.1 hypothetical protein [Bacillota bacterium]HPZ30783.1 hypothetical protein [Limnochordia bacterium]HQD71274.1 hypothetical protein [Limnochordia bacterium]
MEWQKEIEEARTVALRVLDSLEKIEKKLHSARRWGIFDLLGGDFFSSLIKHSKMDDAQRMLRQVQSDLVLLQKELKDIDIQFTEDISASGFEKFMDIVFDNIVSDWLTQSRINKSLQEVARVKAALNDVLITLNRLEQGRE